LTIGELPIVDRRIADCRLRFRIGVAFRGDGDARAREMNGWLPFASWKNSLSGAVLTVTRRPAFAEASARSRRSSRGQKASGGGLGFAARW
jgi:hypothetical protein